MKKNSVLSILLILLFVLLACASVAFLVIGAWWNSWAIACIAVLIYVAIREW